MDYVFGCIERNGVTVENLKTVGRDHTDFEGFTEIVQDFSGCMIIDRFYVVEKYYAAEDAEGNAYDWYIIDKHYRYEDKYSAVATGVKRAMETSEISFVVLAENGSIDAATAGEHIEAFASWQPNICYAKGNLRQYEGGLYQCISAHTSQTGWEPDKTPALWIVAKHPTDEWPVWSAPLGAHDSYQLEDKVKHKDKQWISMLENNVWEPGIYGWREMHDS